MQLWSTVSFEKLYRGGGVSLLPDRMASLIVEALRMSAKESGDDPLWVRDGMSRELSRSLGRELDHTPRRERERSRGRGLSI